MAIIVTSTGETKVVDPENGETWSLKELQAIVGGYIEILAIPPFCGQVMVINEEGLLNGLPVNPLASQAAERPIVGDVLLCSRKEIE